jgi:hypothetical protein
MRRWFDEVLRSSRHDQLSVLAALATTGVAVETRDLENEVSSLHRWIDRRRVGRRAGLTRRVVNDPSQPAVFRLRDLEIRLTDASSDRARLGAILEVVVEERDDLLVSIAAREELLTAQEPLVAGFPAQEARLAAQEQLLVEQNALLVAQEAHLAAQEHLLTQQNASLVERDAAVGARDQALAERADRIDQLRQEITTRDSRIFDLESSSSWRATAPLRALTRAVRRLPGRRPH